MSELEKILSDVAAKEQINISPEQLNQFNRYYELLIEWNEKINLTAITEVHDVAVKHFLDSLLAAKMIDSFAGKTLIDIGTGAGFPGVPLKIMEKDLNVTLFDSLQKRLKFLDLLIQELGLEKIKTIHGRAEDGGQNKDLREKFDLATARAVAKMPVLLEYALPFVKVEGFFIALKGPELDEELKEAAKALKVLGGEVAKISHFSLAGDYTRNIALIKKVAPTPKAYPRKAGNVQKKPLI